MTGTTPAGVVLALRALGLGDALTGIPALRGLRRAYPGHRLVLAAPAGIGGWLRDLGVVDEVLPAAGLEPLAVPADWPGGPGRHVAVNLHGRGPRSHRLLLGTEPGRLVAFGSAEAGHSGGPPWRADEHEVDRWCRLVRSVGGDCGPEDLRLAAAGAGAAPGGDQARAGVVIHPGAASGSRRWPAPRWRALAAALAGRGHAVAITGAPAERALCAQVAGGLCGVRDLSGRLALDRLAALVAGAALLVCGDTGVAHVGTAFGTPSVLLFGPTPPARWGPAIDRERHRVLWRPAGEGFGDPHGRALDPALARIAVPEVLAAAEDLLVPAPRPVSPPRRASAPVR